jgi:glycosyltransferase involved in cell wall biosynthesis
MSIEYSVIIPTHNRKELLAETLGALQSQSNAPSFEIIVVDDGSTDGTQDMVLGRGSSAKLLGRPKSGPAAARNAGARAAAGRWLAFLGDDTIPASGWLAAHAKARERQPDADTVAVIGYTRWHHRIRVTPFLRYINEQGLQFGYGIIQNPEDVPFNFFYTSNLSIGRELFLSELFEEDFPAAAWEDIEAGYRLKKKGMRLIYDHPTNIRTFAVRQETVGKSAVIFFKLHPELGPFLGLSPNGPSPLPAWRHTAVRELAIRMLEHTKFERPDWWKEVMRVHYLKGLHEGWRDRAARL